MRRRKIQGDAAVLRLAARVAERSQGGTARLGQHAEQPAGYVGTAAPESRMTPMAPRPAGVAIAAMVSRAPSSLGMGRPLAIEHALDLPLLEDGKDVVDQ